jgi:hypothetical protein
MSGVGRPVAGTTSAAPAEPRLHSHVGDGLAADHPLAQMRIYCDRCDSLLHLQTNSCRRTWIESGRGNFCVRCFIVVAGGLAPDDARLGGVDRLPTSFGMHSDALTAPFRRRRGS